MRFQATALADARQALINVWAGKELADAFASKTADQIDQAIEEHLDATGVEVAEKTMPTEEGVPPGTGVHHTCSDAASLHIIHRQLAG